MMRLALLALVLFACGCSILSPYDSDYPCKGGYQGKCSSVRGAHMESLAGVDGGIKEQDNPPPCEGEKCQEEAALKAHAVTESNQPSAEEAYKSSLYKRLDNLLQEPRMPVVAPPKVMRILLLPYKGQDGEFYMMRHLYFFVDEPRWILGDSVEEMIE